MNASPSLMGATDLLSVASSLIEAECMAAVAIPDQDQVDAIQQVCQAAQHSVSEASQIIDTCEKMLHHETGSRLVNSSNSPHWPQGFLLVIAGSRRL